MGTFENRMKRTFNQLGMDNTFLDESSPIIPNRSRYYVRDKHHRLRNAPYVDNSCKWAGGGFLSNVHDLVRFGNAMLYSFQHAEEKPFAFDRTKGRSRGAEGNRVEESGKGGRETREECGD